MRKSLAVTLLLLCFSLPFLFGAAQQESGQEGVATVTFMHLFGSPTEKGIMDEVVGLFETANPGIRIEQLVFESAAYHPKVMQTLAGGSPPDVFLGYPGFETRDFVDRGVLGTLTGMWKEYNLDNQFASGVKASVSYKGDQWNIPWASHANIVIYSKKAYDGLGLSEPKTLQEFEANAEALKKSGYYPLASGWKALYRAAYPVELLTPSLGGPEFYKELAAFELDWDNPTVRQMLAIWKKWIERGYWYPDERARTWHEGFGLLMRDEAAMDFIGDYAIPILQDSGWMFGKDFDVFAFPQINRDFPTTFTGPFDSWLTPAKAPNPKEARLFLAFLGGREAQSVRAKAGGLVMNRNVTEVSPALKEIKSMLDAGATFVPGFFQASPRLGVQLINHGAMPDFYDNPDIDEFIRRANAARKEYLAQ